MIVALLAKKTEINKITNKNTQKIERYNLNKREKNKFCQHTQHNDRKEHSCLEAEKLKWEISSRHFLTEYQKIVTIKVT